MATIAAGNLPSKLSVHRLFSIWSTNIPNWFWRNEMIMMCSKSVRNYSSSPGAVKYIPKDKRKLNEQLGNSNSFSKVENDSPSTMLSHYDRNLNGNEPGMIPKEMYIHAQEHEHEQETEDEIGSNVEIEEPEYAEESEIKILHVRDNCKKNVQASRTMLDAEKMAIGLLATRAFTAVELRKKLLGKRFTPDIVEHLITEFQTRGMINDSLYAESYSRSRWSSSSWGPKRIMQGLFRKGVSESEAENAIKLVFQGEKSRDLESTAHGMSKTSLENLLVQASKQWLRGQDVPRDTRKARVTRWLQYRGFNWSVINIILKKLESQHSS